MGTSGLRLYKTANLLTIFIGPTKISGQGVVQSQSEPYLVWIITSVMKV